MPTQGDEPVTITGFLLARIAEDEVTARSIESVSYRPRWATDADGRVVEAPPTPPDFKRRVLAECEAKRLQIEHLVRAMEGDYAPWNQTQLEIMAAVYADHPDYDEAWRL